MPRPPQLRCFVRVILLHVDIRRILLGATEMCPNYTSGTDLTAQLYRESVGWSEVIMNLSLPCSCRCQICAISSGSVIGHV
jgi:hypothetical protein